MIKFQITAAPEVTQSLQNRVVCDITETKASSRLLGEYASWYGSTENEYFSILFSKGILMVSVHEREMKLTENPINYASTEKRLETLESLKNLPKDTSTETIETIYLKYDMVEAVEEHKEVSMMDVMSALNWKFKTGTKIWYDKYNS